MRDKKKSITVIGWIMSSKTYVHPGPQNVTLFENRVFVAAVKLRRDHQGGALIQYDLVSL